MLIISCFCMKNYNTVSDEASHSNRSWYKFLMIKKRRFISIAWPVAMASLPLNTEQCLYKNTIKLVFVPIIVLTPPSRLPLSQNNRTICWWGDKICLLTFMFNMLQRHHSLYKWLRLYSVRTGKIYRVSQKKVSVFDLT
jgi:hypothetical protein